MSAKKAKPSGLAFYFGDSVFIRYLSDLSQVAFAFALAAGSEINIYLSDVFVFCPSTRGA